MENLTHLDREGRVRMVDVTAKPQTDRTALAQGWVRMAPATLQMIRQQGLKKGNVLETARIAGVLAAKKTADLIPMCHPLNITHCQIDFFPDEPGSRIRIEASVRIVGQTGVEMEALTAVALAALTIYDMCKAVDREMTISDICVLKKSGGKSGDFERDGSR
jgi:cyclic pyranopterin monophosphate synthase